MPSILQRTSYEEERTRYGLSLPNGAVEAKTLVEFAVLAEGAGWDDEHSKLPEDEWCYELVEGRLVRMSPTGAGHGRIVRSLTRAVDRFVTESDLGEIFPAETGFLVSAPDQQDTVLAPDLAFVHAVRVPEREPASCSR